MSRHKMKVSLAHGPADLGAEVDLEISFEYRAGSPAKGPTYFHGGLPADPPEIEFISCKGPLEGDGRDKYRQATFDLLAEQFLEGDGGFAEALEIVAADDERAREYAAEMRE